MLLQLHSKMEQTDNCQVFEIIYHPVTIIWAVLTVSAYVLHTLWDPSRLFVFAAHLSIMSRALTALGIEVHLETE